MERERMAALKMLDEMNQVILGKKQFTFQVLAALLADGHILLEDIPGVGKTTLALAVSKMMGLSWKRVQFTPDVLPSDLTGFTMYRRDIQKFVYQPGAVFCNLLLADEINRTSPKTQSALLEVMEERQVTVDGETREVPAPFFVIATQNPIGATGTQRLPEAQMDRFLVSLTIGYPNFENEVLMAKDVNKGKRADRAQIIMDTDMVRRIQNNVQEIYIHDEIYAYIVKLMDATRNHPDLEMGVSPRGTIAMVKLARAVAWLSGQDFVSPLDVSGQFLAVTRHRVKLSRKAEMEERGRGAGIKRNSGISGETSVEKDVIYEKIVYIFISGMIFYIAGLFRIESVLAAALAMAVFGVLLFLEVIIQSFLLQVTLDLEETWGKKGNDV